MNRDNKRKRTFVKHFVNPLLRNFAHSSRGPFALLRHVGRRSGKTYEIPIMVWRVKDGFVITLTYGPNVDWLRNLQAADQGSLRWHTQICEAHHSASRLRKQREILVAHSTDPGWTPLFLTECITVASSNGVIVIEQEEQKS